MSSPSTTNQDKRQMKTISLTIPMDCNALTRSAEMLTGLAADISGAETTVEGLSFADRLTHFNEIAAEKIAAVARASKAETPEGEFVADKLAGSRDDRDGMDSPHEKTPAEVFGEADILERWNEALDGTRVHDEAILNKVETARVLEEMESKSISPDQAAGAVDQHPEEGVELDGDHLPWDHRIHASSKAKLSKAPNCWKRKRNIDPDVIAEVEAELRAAMSAGPHNPVKPAPANPAVPAEPATPAPAAPTDSTVATFPELMAAITAGGIAPPAVQAALNLQGITSLPLLASRPDLIPAVAEILGV
jgi:hypothetical protein